MKKITVVAMAVLLLVGACTKSGDVKLRDGADSLAYIIGMNVGQNLLKMDSTLNAEVVCEAIRDVFKGEQRFTNEDARTYYLRYVTFEKPEKMRAVEERFLEDIRLSNRSYARTKSGVTYTVESVGDEKQTPSRDQDSISIRYLMRTVDGQQVYSSYERKDTLRVTLGDLVEGMRDGVRLIGKGGKMQAWLPAATAYGVDGNKELGIGANATLFVEIELVGMNKNLPKPSRNFEF